LASELQAVARTRSRPAAGMNFLDEFPALLFQNATRHLNPLIQSTFYRDVKHTSIMVGTDGQPRLTHRVNRQLRLSPTITLHHPPQHDWPPPTWYPCIDGMCVHPWASQPGGSPQQPPPSGGRKDPPLPQPPCQPLDQMMGACDPLKGQRDWVGPRSRPASTSPSRLLLGPRKPGAVTGAT